MVKDEKETLITLMTKTETHVDIECLPCNFFQISIGNFARIVIIEQLERANNLRCRIPIQYHVRHLRTRHRPWCMREEVMIENSQNDIYYVVRIMRKKTKK